MYSPDGSSESYKIGSENEGAFRSGGDIVYMELNPNSSTLTFSINDNDNKITFKNIPKKSYKMAVYLFASDGMPSGVKLLSYLNSNKMDDEEKKSDVDVGKVIKLQNEIKNLEQIIKIKDDEYDALNQV